MTKEYNKIVNLLQKEKMLIALGLPAWLFAFLQIGLSFITIAFAGTVGEEMLAGVGLCNAIYNVMLWSPLLGFTSVLDTFGPQIYATKSRQHHLGTITLKICLQGILVYLMVLGPYLNAAHIVRILPHDGGNSTRDVTSSSRDMTSSSQLTSNEITVMFMRLICPVPLMDFFGNLVSKFLTIQGHIKAVYFISGVTIGVHVVFNFVMVNCVKWGVTGLAVAALLTRIFTLIILLFYCRNKRNEMAWSGFTNKALENWSGTFKLGISGGASMFVEFGMFEIGTLCSSFIGTTALAMFAVMFQFVFGFYTIPYGIATATSILMGDAIGRKDVAGIRSYMKLTVLNTIAESLLIALLFYFFRDYLVLIFTREPGVVYMFVSVAWIKLMQFPMNHIQTVLSRGILTTFGKQRYIAVSLAVIGYLICTPLIVLVVFRTDLGPTGILLVFLVFNTLNTLSFAVRIVTLDLEKEISSAEKRAAKERVGEMVEWLEEDVSPIVDESLLSDKSPLKPKQGHVNKGKYLVVIYLIAILLASVLIYISFLDIRT